MYTHTIYIYYIYTYNGKVKDSMTYATHTSVQSDSCKCKWIPQNGLSYDDFLKRLSFFFLIQIIFLTEQFPLLLPLKKYTANITNTYQI